MTELTARELLVMLYDTALDAVDGRYLVSQWLRQAENKNNFSHCVAIGKAGAAMFQGALDAVPGLKKSLLICPPSKLTRSLKKIKISPVLHPRIRYRTNVLLRRVTLWLNF